MIQLYQGDVLTAKPEGKYHALLCDAPYEYGFMGKSWDASGVSFNPDTWAALAEHLHPGAFGMVFGGARTWHRIAVAIEDAGLIIHPTIFNWVYGSGFPKATRIKGRADFEGHRYGLQALKPAAEPIIVFQKPYEGRPVDCIVETGAGALWIDGGRIEGIPPSVPQPAFKSPTGMIYGFATGEGRNGEMSSASGRWPANFVLSDEAAAALDEQSGERGGSGQASGPTCRKMGTTGIYNGAKGDGKEAPFYGDTGGASRFFFTYQFDQLDEAEQVYYCAKSSRSERDAGLERRNPHPTVKPIALARYLATLLLPPAEYGPRRLLVPFAGVGSEMIGGMLAGWEDVTGIEREAEYIDIARARLDHWQRKAVQPYLLEVSA